MYLVELAIYRDQRLRRRDAAGQGLGCGPKMAVRANRVRLEIRPGKTKAWLETRQPVFYVGELHARKKRDAGDELPKLPEPRVLE